MAVKTAELSDSALLMNELVVVKNLQCCPYICRCYGEEMTIGESNNIIHNLILEYLIGGTLAEANAKLGGNGLPESDVRRYTKYILKSFSHIHCHGYIHCDLMPEHIVIIPTTISNGTKHVAKISDFGLAKRAEQINERAATFPSLMGSLRYLSLESVVEKRQRAPGDVWALACVVVEMLTGKPMWDGKKDSEIEEILSEIGEGNREIELPSEISREAKDFLKGCFARKAMDRFTAWMLLDHPFCRHIGRHSCTEEDE